MPKAVDIEVGEFKKKLDRGEISFLLDMRQEEEFASWRIEGGKPVETINIPQIDFVGEEEKYLSQLPKDREIFLVCAHGGASKYEAELLQSKGYQAFSLAGGMVAWSIYYETSRLAGTPLIQQIYRIAKGCITHVVISNGEAVVIDAVRHIEQIRAILTGQGARLKYVFDTHLQADHISGGRELAQAEACPYLICPADAAGAAYPYQPLIDGDEFTFGACSLTALHTPGHTPGSSSLLMNGKILFSGDTIMETTVGRPDLGGKVEEWAKLLYNTIHNRLKPLSDEILILPTHAASVMERDEDGLVKLSLGEARRTLPHFSLIDQADFVSYVKSTLLVNPDRYQEIRKVNLGLLTPDETHLQELEIGKNLCGMAGKNSESV
ncbi:MAG: MBL fold metallo-hydrolase [Desulfobulbaceae bacterium]|nr:MBL fold metallo-hydrolase [Desulfobulbaceae bacterium]